MLNRVVVKLSVWVEKDVSRRGTGDVWSEGTELVLREVRIGDSGKAVSMAREAIIALQLRAESGLPGSLPNEATGAGLFYDKIAQEDIPNTLDVNSGPPTLR